MKNKYAVACMALVLLALAVSLAVYPTLPEDASLPTHWNIHGQVDGYGSRTTVFLMPGIMAGMLVLFWLVLPALSPKRYDVESFRRTYDYLVLCVFALMAYLHGVILWASLHGPLNPARGIMGGTFLFLILMGNVLGKVRRNFWIGVRTPWTLADDRVWNATHRLAGWVFVIAGLAGLIAVFAGLSILYCVAPLVAATLVTVIYSLVFYKRLERRGEL